MVPTLQQRILSAFQASLLHRHLEPQANRQHQPLEHLLEDQHLVNHQLLAQSLIHSHHHQLSGHRHSLALEEYLDSLHNPVEEAPLDNHPSLEEVALGNLLH